MKNVLLAVVVLSFAYSATADLVSSYTGLPNLSSSNLSSTQSVAVAVGDVVVMAAGSNKKASVSAITFATTEGGTFTDADAESVVGNDPNPNAYISYLAITSPGTYDFVATSSGAITANVGIFLLSAGSGEIAMVGGTAERWTGLAPAESSTLNNTVAWAADPTYGAGQLVTVSSSLRGNIIYDTILTDGFDGGPGKRISGSVPIAAGQTSIDDIWNLTNAHATNNESGSIAALAFVEVIPEPTSLALLGLGSLVWLLRRREDRA